MNEMTWIVVLTAVVLYAASAAWLGRFSITMPLVFVLVGALMGPDALGLVSLPVSVAAVEHTVEITLALLLFADAAGLDLRRIRADATLPARLLLIGLPLSVILGTAAALALFPAAGFGVALLLAAILAPTDAALGAPIFANPNVPARVRRALNVESGFNDGIAAPLVTLAIAMSIAPGSLGQAGILPALADIGIAVVVGAILGALGGRLFGMAEGRGWSSAVSLQIGGVALALGCYWTSLAFGGNGFIAGFVGGLVFGVAMREGARHTVEFAELTGTLLSLLVWTIFGANLVPLLIEEVSPQVLLFAVLALTVVRMVPVAVALLGTGLRPETVAMMGWLGPRGLASVVFTLIAVEAFESAGVDPSVLAPAGWAVLLSVILHAVTASPLAGWYAARLERAGSPLAELADARGDPPDMPARRSQLGP